MAKHVTAHMRACELRNGVFFSIPDTNKQWATLSPVLAARGVPMDDLLYTTTEFP